MLEKAYQYRLYPTNEQTKFLDTCLAINRKVWNAILEVYNKTYEESKADPANEGKGKSMSKSEIDRFATQFINIEGNEWMKQGIKRSLELLTYNNFMSAWKRYFENLKNGKVKEAQDRYRTHCQTTGKVFKLDRLRDIGKPKFKSWKDKQSFQLDRSNNAGNYSIDLHAGLLTMAKLRGKPLRFKIKPDDKILAEDVLKTKTLTFSKTSTGKYYLSIAIEVDAEIPPTPKVVTLENTVGVDFGVKHLAILSNGEKIENPRHLIKAQNKLKRLQRKASRQYRMNKDAKGQGVSWREAKTKNWEKSQLKIAKLHEQVKNRRKAVTHQLSHDLVTSDFEAIAIEDLNVKGMTTKTKAKKREGAAGFEQTGKKRKSGLNRSLVDANFGELRRQLEYKAEWEGKKVLRIDRFAPSSKTCSQCGYINKDLKLKHRHWKCPSCGVEHDRDINAAINIRNFAVKA